MSRRTLLVSLQRSSRSLSLLCRSRPSIAVGLHHDVRRFTGMSNRHLGEELPQSSERITVNTQYGPVRGGRAGNGAIAFLGAFCRWQSLCNILLMKTCLSRHGIFQKFRMHCLQRDSRMRSPCRQIIDMRIKITFTRKAVGYRVYSLAGRILTIRW